MYYERYFLPQDVLFLCDNFILPWLLEPMFAFWGYLLFEILFKTITVKNLIQDYKCVKVWRIKTKPKCNDICEGETSPGAGGTVPGTTVHF